ncbi:MAG: helix-turn-helix domain-containing protein [Mogibacterium sp.]|nr:helix-turn-helix domain-containing protein [Mogibacterium sp.]MBQ6315183.1 helix-turn-helix domain-containing protein [Mogibacterium sp.]
MNSELLKILSKITPEEQEILDGRSSIDRSLYYQADQSAGAHGRTDEVDASLVLTNGKLIDMRPHTRFIHFPEHTHNYVEFVYMCQGQTTHIIDGNRILLKEGDLLFMNQNAHQEIMPAGETDIAVNFMIMPHFFDTVLRNLENESGALRDFLISCLTDRDMGGNYLYFDAADILPVQNLMENMVWIMINEPQNRRTLSQNTISLLFMTLIDQASHLHVSGSSYEQKLLLHLFNYIDTQYQSASLSEFAEEHHEDIYTLSRFIKRKTGRTFKDLLVEKRLRQAEYLLNNTALPVADISLSVGYENTSYFHRIFRDAYGMSPRDMRLGRVRGRTR